MSHKSSANHSSRPSAFYSFHSGTSPPTSSRPSLSPPHLHTRPSTSPHAASRPSETYLSCTYPYYIPPSALSDPLDPTMRAETRDTSCYRSPTLPPIDARPSISNYQLDYLKQNSWSDEHSSRSTPLPCQRVPSVYHWHSSPHPATNVPYPDPTIFHHPQASTQDIYREQLSYIPHQPEDLVYSVHRLTLEPESNRQGPTYCGEGMFSKSQNFSVNNSTFIDHSTASDNFMERLLLHTIIGAEHDSSERNPPPRCHPGTRLAIVGRCKAFVIECDGKEKMRWVMGPAGVGKSAILQMVAEETPADASVFLSVDGRQDGTKTFTTIAYQLAAKYEPYLQFVRNEITRDPSLLRKLLPVQFNKFIVEPFIHRNLFNPSRRFSIIIDGLDECDNALTQRKLLELISEFCISYPTSPIVWLIASRPEPHITSFFSRPNVQPAYTKEEISIDSDEACEDVQRYLREELNEIKLAYPTLKRKREWPSELEFTTIATTAGGLFAYASTVIRYINDPYYGDPTSQLGDVLVAMEGSSTEDRWGSNNPLASLDALYARIISKIPDGAMTNANKILLLYSQFGNFPWRNFRTQCNRLGLTEDAAYGAVRHLHAVVKVPEPDKADDEGLTYFHKSFEDFLFDSKRSEFSRNARDEVGLLKAWCSLRIIEQVPATLDSIASSENVLCGDYGYLKAGPSLCDNISLSWPGDERYSTTDYEFRCQLYASSVDDMCYALRLHDTFFPTVSCFHALTARFSTLDLDFPIHWVAGVAFDKLRAELMDVGILKQVPLWALDYAAICGPIQLQFAGPVGNHVNYSNPWNANCKHKKSIRVDKTGLPDRQRWTTRFQRSLDDLKDGVAQTDIPRFNIKAGKDSHRISHPVGRSWPCLHCSERFARQLINNPDRLATVFVDATELCYVEWSFVDPDDGVSEWRYRFYHSGPPLCVS